MGNREVVWDPLELSSGYIHVLADRLEQHSLAAHVTDDAHRAYCTFRNPVDSKLLPALTFARQARTH